MSPALLLRAWSQARRKYDDELEAALKRKIAGASRNQRDRDRQTLRRLGVRERRFYSAYVAKSSLRPRVSP